MGPCNHWTKSFTRIFLFILIEQMEMKSGAQGTIDVRHNSRRHLNSLPQAHGNGGHDSSPVVGIGIHAHSHINSHSIPNLPSHPHPHPDWTFTYHRVTPSKENGTGAAFGRKRKSNAIAAMSIASISDAKNNKGAATDFLEAGATTTTTTTKLPEFKQWASILEKELEAEDLHWRPWIHLDSNVDELSRALKSDSDLPPHQRRHKRRHWKRHHDHAHARARHHRHGDFG